MTLVGAGAAMVIEKVRESFKPPIGPVAVTVKLDVPTAVGVPDITPVAALSDNPLGNVPTLIDHVTGPVPIASRVAINNTSNVPFGRPSVMISGGSGAYSISRLNVLVSVPCGDEA